MKLLLKEFQVDAVEDLVANMRDATSDVARRNRPQAVSLASPTGSGKTVMATAAIERLLDGDDENPPERNAVFLWISDQPEINEQTRRKMLDASSVLGPSRLTVIDAAFDQEQLSPGQLYFLNTQKLAKDRNLVKTGDKRQYTIWDTIARTVAATPENVYFFVFIDEAHRGMLENDIDREQAATIIQKFIKGSAGEVPPVPIVIGISATPSRFQTLVAGTPRTVRQVVVPVDQVRSSGLLKETITLHHPTETQPSDLTLLRLAARSWQTYGQHWAAYCDAQGEPTVEPILVIQVEDGNERQVSRTNLSEVLAAIQDEVGPLPPEAFAHAFQEGTTLTVAGQPLRYLAPADIDPDPDVKVVLFKTGLNTGWDCPRAEVMMSFRRAVDATFIAQLIGRMVRTPLARRVDADEFLNTVALYLPHFDRPGLDRVVGELTAADHDVVPPVDVERGEDVVLCSRNAEMSTCFDALKLLPSYVIPTASRTNQVRRLLRFARLLEQDDLIPDASEEAKSLVLHVLREEHDRLKDTEQFRARVSTSAALDLRAVTLQYASGQTTEVTTTVTTSTENIDDLFGAAGRKLAEGLHKEYWRERVKAGGITPTLAKLEVHGLAAEPVVLDNLQRAARHQIATWLEAHELSIEALPEGRRQAYDAVRRLAGEPEKTTLIHPDIIEVRTSEMRWQRHLYADDTGEFTVTLNKWEKRVIEEVLADTAVEGWLRNPDRKPWSLAIPYEFLGETRPLYPDFLIFRRDGTGLKIDLLDPHLVSLEDAPAKAAGLARYAAKHGAAFGRMELIIVENERIQRLNLKDEAVRDRVRAVSSSQHLRDLFDLA